MQSHSRLLADHKPPSKAVAYAFMGIIALAMVFFVYNWWRCRQNRVIEEEMEDYQHDYSNEKPPGFKPTQTYQPPEKDI